MGTVLKILCINSNGLKNDGITNSILNYYSHMDTSDVSIDMLETKDVDPAIEDKIKRIGLNIVRTDYRKHILSYIFKTAKRIKSEKYDIVHVHGSSAILSIDLLAAWLGGCKVRIAHSRNTTCDHKMADKILRPFFYSLCTDRFACGEDAGKWLFGKRPFTVIHNGKDIEQFKFNKVIRQKIREQYSLEDRIAVGHVGNFNYQKNHEFLIELFAELKKKNPKYKLFLMGSGQEYLDKAKEQVQQLGIEQDVVFMGSINNVPDILQAMDIMLFPSRFEGLPNVVLEWQISGLPCIISDKITSECKVTDLVQYLPIDKGFETWITMTESVHVTQDRTQVSETSCEQMKASGFDIKENAVFLKSLYQSMVNKKKKAVK